MKAKKIILFFLRFLWWIFIGIVSLVSFLTLVKIVFFPKLFDRTHYPNDYRITGVKELTMEDIYKNKIIPENFTIRPAQAFLIAGREGKISLKHEFVCYYDEEYYYFADIFLRTYPIEDVVKWGAKVNGRTGDVVKKGEYVNDEDKTD